MLLSDTLEIAIGLSFVFTMLSMVLTTINETVETVLKARGTQLYAGICELLADEAKDGPAPNQKRVGKHATAPGAPLGPGEAAARDIYRHPLVQGLMRGSIATALKDKLLPSYVPSRNFALAFIGQALDGKLQPATTTAKLPTLADPGEQLRFAAERIANAQVRGVLLQAIEVGRGDMDAIRTHLEQLYDSAMDRVSGWYKRRTQRIIFVLGLLIAIALNVNTLTIADSLSESATLRRTIVAEASTTNAQGLPALSAQDASNQITATGLPVGWSSDAVTALDRPLRAPLAWSVDSSRANALGLLQILCGWLLTAFAVSLGAPFWFDVLNRLMVIRATVKPTEKSQDEAPQDPQPSTPRSSGTLVVVQPPAPPPPPAPAGETVDSEVYASPDTVPERWFEDDAGTPVEGVGAGGYPDAEARK